MRVFCSVDANSDWIFRQITPAMTVFFRTRDIGPIAMLWAFLGGVSLAVCSVSPASYEQIRYCTVVLIPEVPMSILGIIIVIMTAILLLLHYPLHLACLRPAR